MAVTANVILPVGVPLCVLIHTLAVKLAPLATTEVTLCAGPFHEAVRPVRNSECVPPWTTLVFDANVPAPKTDQPVVPLSMSAFVRRFPLAASAPYVDTANSDASVKTTARPSEPALMILFLFTLLLSMDGPRLGASCASGVFEAAAAVLAFLGGGAGRDVPMTVTAPMPC